MSEVATAYAPFTLSPQQPPRSTGRYICEGCNTPSAFLSEFGFCDTCTDDHQERAHKLSQEVFTNE